MMEGVLRIGRWGRIAQLTALGAGSLALAACAPATLPTATTPPAATTRAQELQ